MSSAVRRCFVVFSLSLALATIGPPVAPVLAAEPEPPGDCPDTLALSEVAAGQTGVGWTVVRGTEPRPFEVEVLGVFPDGILPGHDVILVRVSDLGDRHFIEDARGIWAGMSGSPVYIDGRLVGAVAYGYSAGPSTLGGLTPVGEMLEVGDLETDLAAAGLSPRLRRALRGASPASAGLSGFGRLALPVTLPAAPKRAPRGATRQRRQAMKARFDLADRLADRGLRALPIGGPNRAAGARVAAAERPVPGGNFAASLSFGDLDVVAMGTTTWVCGERAVAFGHPLLHTGRTNLGMHLADSLDIVDDPTFSPFKLAVPGPIIGRVGQDRTAGVAGRMDRVPELLTVTSLTRQRARDRVREGTSRIAGHVPRFLQYELPAFHAEANVLSVVDAYEDGSVGIVLDVTGRREDGSPFRVRFGDRWIGGEDFGASASDSASAALYGVGIFLSWLVENPFDRVVLDDVDMVLDVGTSRAWQLVGLSVSRNGGPPSIGPSICVARGDRLRVRTLLASVPGEEVVEEQLRLTVPRRFRSLRVGGGSGLSPWFDPSRYGSLDGLLQALRSRSRSDELVARVVADGLTQAQKKRRLDRVTFGGATVTLKPLGSPSCS